MPDHGNILAHLALILWVPISLGLFAVLRPAPAAAVCILGADLLLPVRFGFDFAGFPLLDSERIAALSALLGCLLFHPDSLRGKRPGLGIEALVVVLVLGAFLTAFTNQDPLRRGPGWLPPMAIYDGVSLAAGQILTYGIPFFLGRALVRRSTQLPSLLIILAAAGLFYSLPILFELRMSPRLHAMVYGYSQHGFMQTVRFGGWRPMVFMTHGLALALFVLTTSIAAVGLWRRRLRILWMPAAPVAVYLTTILVMCKSLATVVYGAFLLPIVAFARPRTQLRVAALLAALVFLYPVLRSADALPTEPMLEFAARVSEDRAASWKTRLDNEEQLLEKARERIWFGWGSWGRNRIYDPRSGDDRSVTDGFWIITLGAYGTLGFVAVFGLLLTPVILAQRRLARSRLGRDQRMVAILALIVAISAVDLIPNSMLTSFTVFLSGALAGVVPGILRAQKAATPL